MTSKDRVRITLSHEMPDRLPMQISFTPEFKERLLGVYPKVASSSDPYALDIKIGSDLLLETVGWMTSYNQPGDQYVDEWGIGWKAVEYTTPFGVGRYTEVENRPLAEDEAIASYSAPDPFRKHLYEPMQNLLALHGSEYCIVGVVKTTIFECAWGLRGLEQLMMDFILDPDLAEAVLDIPLNYHLEVAKKLVSMGVDMIWIGDDVGSQNGMMISPDSWRYFLKPRMASCISALRAIRKDIVIAYHSDGVIDPIIPDLIEIGVDILNPIQPNCMDPSTLKKQYGKNASFWGGIDQQSVLPFSSPMGVYENTKSMMSILGEHGGYIVGPTHNVQLDVPLENFDAMVRAITEN
ncbi:MAG: uroporphyrinogen decarboxylase family protein [Sphaerochaeta sp.]|nr:uroporphyrinogen decarboxylase family protein [Sphaerochaeta sp.]